MPVHPAQLQAGSISQADYPPEARQRKEQGRSVVKYEVGMDGVPRDCTVASSSGSKSLDAASCDIILSRFRFTIPRDGKGNPVIQQKVQGISWSLDRPATEPASGNIEYTSTVVFHYDVDGNLVSCDPGTGSATNQGMCDAAKTSAKGRKMTLGGQPTAYEYRVVTTTIITPE